MNILRALSAMAFVCAMTATPALVVNHTVHADAKVTTNTVTHTETATLPFSKGGENEQVSIRKQSHKAVATTVSGEVVTVKKQYWQVPLNHDLQSYIAKLCVKYGVSQELAYGVMETESNFNPHKISNTDDYGLFQINVVNRPWLARKFGITDWFNPYQNAEAGIYMLSQLTHKYSDTNTVLIAYNGGEGYMRTLENKGVYSTEYSRKVESYMSALKKV